MKRDMESRKWLDEYMSLKQVNENNPFTVPPGYFDELEKNIISAVNLEKLKGDKGFTVPENYFDELSNNIQSRINIDALVNNDDDGHAVPENYFDALTNNIQSRINIDAFVNNDADGHAIPENYFDELSSNIQSRINIDAFVNSDADGHAVPENYFADMEQQISARITVEETLNEKETFTVPEDYFEKLNKSILNKTVNQDIVKRKGVVRRMFASSAFKYAAAACLAVVVGTGLLVQNSTNPVTEHNKSFLHKQLSTVSTGDIQSYLQDDVDPSETQHTVIDENAPVNDAGLSNALQNDLDNNN